MEGLKEDDFRDLVEEGDYHASDTSDDEDYNVGGRQGFQTNIDDFLLNFASMAASERVNNRSLTTRLKSSQLPLLYRAGSEKNSDHGD